MGLTQKEVIFFNGTDVYQYLNWVPKLRAP